MNNIQITNKPFHKRASYHHKTAGKRNALEIYDAQKLQIQLPLKRTELSSVNTTSRAETAYTSRRLSRESVGINKASARPNYIKRQCETLNRSPLKDFNPPNFRRELT